MRILITEFMDPSAVDALRAEHDVIYDPSLVDDSARLFAQALSCDALIVRNRTEVRGTLLSSLTRCTLIGRLGVGLDNIDVAACEARGMRVIPATGANAQSVAEYVVGTAMLLLRGSYASTVDVVQGRWPRNQLSGGRELAGKTLGLIGFGSIGQRSGRLAAALSMRVIAFDPALNGDEPPYAAIGVVAAPLNEVLETADVISLHVPLSDRTRNMIDRTRVAAMKTGAILINTSRGGVVDEHAVADALRSGDLGGAALDVFTQEPLPKASHFEGCPNLLLTPHIAGVTRESNERVSRLVAERVLEALR